MKKWKCGCGQISRSMSFLQKFCSSNIIETNVRTPTGTFRGFRDIIHRDRNRRTPSPNSNGLNNEAYRAALNAFLARRKNSNDPEYILPPNSPERARYILKKNEKNTIENNANNGKSNIIISKLPNADSSEIIEIGWVAGTKDRYIDLMYAEWQNTKVCLRRHRHPDCKNAVKADLEVLSEIRHPNILLLMGITQTDDDRIIAICEPIDCTLYNYIHEQGERVAMQGIAKCAKNLAAAIKHAHMLGYIHSAISSHCVFLNSNGIMKLGGWELAIDINGPKKTRDYEKRLRSEIFRWQAPELFIRQKVSTATDVYGLTLLIWEMCTMNIPWNGLNFAEVERHYVHWKRGIIIDLHNFPPLLINLLETGMQLDVTKRTRDMNKMSRLLKQLEMRYEDAEPIYIEQLMNNNDQTKSIFTSSKKISPSYKASIVCNYVDTKTKKQYSERMNSLANSREKKTREEKRQERHEHLFENQGNRMKFVNEVLQTKNNDHNNYIKSETKLNKVEVNELKKPQLNLDSQCDTNEICNLIDKDTDYSKDSRLSIRKLKETLANQRKNFFYGDNSLDDPIPLIDELSKPNMLCHVRSKDYKPHKPASHKTSLEPKQIPSSSQNLSNGLKSIYRKNQRMPYAYVPTPIRNAVIQPQILNSDSHSFFETSLWQREKSICLSKMSGNNSDDFKSYNQYKTNHTQFSKNTCQVNDTFTVDDHSLSSNNSKDNQEDYAQINDSSVNITASTIPRSKSLQALKDALERVTGMARPTSPIISSSIDATPLKFPKAHNKAIDNSDVNKLKHTEAHKLHEKPQDTVRRTERSISYTTFNIMPAKSIKSNTEQKLMQKVNNYGTQIVFSNKTSITSPPIPAPRKIQCATADINSNRNNFLIINEKKTGKKLINPIKIETDATFCNEVTQENTNECFPLFTSNDQSARETECLSCSRNSLLRPRSLPAQLELLNTNSCTSLKKVPRKMSDSSNDTVEDLYIDDEFGEYDLAPNMILLNEDTATDEESYFPDLLESKPNSMYFQI